MVQDEPRIGVFVCHCGTNIAGVVDVEEVAQYALTLKNVVHSQTNLYTCSDAGINSIKEGIKKYNLNRVVVASCTPRTHEPLFRRTCQEAGVNPFLFEFVNIREHCSWVHSDEPEKATQKAKELVRMGIAKARFLQPQEEIENEVEPRALVIGGGISGMSAALTLAQRGFEVYLIEREKYLGGVLRKLYKLYPTSQEAKSILEPMIRSVTKNEKIKIFTSSVIKETSGYIGNYNIKVETKGKETELKVGVIIVAIGAKELKPKKLYNYDGENVITQLELEKRLKDKDPQLSNIKSSVMIFCAGSRIPERPYCSKICCMNGIKNALILQEINPKINIYILYRDIMTYGEYEDNYYRVSREKGITYLKYSPEKPPVVEKGKVVVYDKLLGEEIELPSDLTILSTPLVSPDGEEELSRMLKVPIDVDGFLLEAHVKLRPVEFATDGVYLSGCCHWPTDLKGAIVEGYAAASKASIPLVNKKVKVEPIVSFVDEEKCIGCGLCESICPYTAIEVKQTEKGRKAKTISASCKGCGLCGASCPEGAITMQHFSNEQELAMICAFGGEK